VLAEAMRKDASKRTRQTGTRGKRKVFIMVERGRI